MEVQSRFRKNPRVLLKSKTVRNKKKGTANTVTKNTKITTRRDVPVVSETKEVVTYGSRIVLRRMGRP